MAVVSISAIVLPLVQSAVHCIVRLLVQKCKRSPHTAEDTARSTTDSTQLLKSTVMTLFKTMEEEKIANTWTMEDWNLTAHPPDLEKYLLRLSHGHIKHLKATLFWIMVLITKWLKIYTQVVLSTLIYIYTHLNFSYRERLITFIWKRRGYTR